MELVTDQLPPKKNPGYATGGCRHVYATGGQYETIHTTHNVCRHYSEDFGARCAIELECVKNGIVGVFVNLWNFLRSRVPSNSGPLVPQ